HSRRGSRRRSERSCSQRVRQKPKATAAIATHSRLRKDSIALLTPHFCCRLACKPRIRCSRQFTMLGIYRQTIEGGLVPYIDAPQSQRPALLGRLWQVKQLRGYHDRIPPV